jgi:hypothetical protein
MTNLVMYKQVTLIQVETAKQGRDIALRDVETARAELDAMRETLTVAGDGEEAARWGFLFSFHDPRSYSSSIIAESLRSTWKVFTCSCRQCSFVFNSWMVE